MFWWVPRHILSPLLSFLTVVHSCVKVRLTPSFWSSVWVHVADQTCFFKIFASKRSASYILIPAFENDVLVIAENFTFKTTQKHRNWETDFHCHTASNIMGILKPLLLNCSQLSRAPTAILGFTASFNFTITHSILYCTKKLHDKKCRQEKMSFKITSWRPISVRKNWIPWVFKDFSVTSSE